MSSSRSGRERGLRNVDFGFPRKVLRAFHARFGIPTPVCSLSSGVVFDWGSDRHKIPNLVARDISALLD